MADLESFQCPVVARPRAELDQAARRAVERQAVRSHLAALYPGLSPGLLALGADLLLEEPDRPGHPLILLTGL